jgi:hypothetical protein
MENFPQPTAGEQQQPDRSGGEGTNLGESVLGHLEKFFSPSRCESDSLTAMGHG